MTRLTKVAALLGCIVSMLVVLPVDQASAHRWALKGDARAYTVYTMDEAPSELGRWDPCTPIGYRINDTAAAAGAVADVQKAVRRLSRATGLTFVYRGTTSVVPQAAWADDAYPVDTQLVIAWVLPAQSTLWPGTISVDSQDTLAGRGGSWHVPAVDAAGQAWGRYNRGFVLLNARVDLPAGFRATGTSGSRGQEIMHELAHVVGLDHPQLADPQEVMYPELTPKPAHWGRGDLAGLRIVGAAGGCLRDTASWRASAPVL